jgi:hypothetical protein
MRGYGTTRNSMRLGAIVAGMLLLMGCAHHMRPMTSDHTLVISGRYTANDEPALASRKVVVEAARLTLNHGFRYFKFAGSAQAAPSVRPGTDVTIQVYREGDVDPRAPGIWDALDVGTGEAMNKPRS